MPALPSDRQDSSTARHTREFEPVRVLEVELSEPLRGVVAFDEHTGQNYRRAISLVRLHTQPLGVVELDLGETGLTGNEYAHQIWRVLGVEIREHLRRDMLPEVTELDADGLAFSDTPKCLRERETLLANAPPVSVVVATRDRTASLATCLESLLALDYPNYEIIVVDNAPETNETADFVKQTYGHLAAIRYVREDHPGLASAHNCGLTEVRGEIVAFTDDDVVVDRSWLMEIVRGFNMADNVACVTGLILPAELQTRAQVWFEQSVGFGKGFASRICDLSENQPKDFLFPYAAGSCGSGANMAFKTAVLRDIGGFDPALGTGTGAMGGDDLAAFFEVIVRGYRLVYRPEAIIYHWHPREYNALHGRAYAYGVGLTAYLTKVLLDRPWRLPDLAIRVPSGVVYALSCQSPKNRSQPPDYPRELIRNELKGMLYGPFAFLRSRWRTRGIRKMKREGNCAVDDRHRRSEGDG